MELNADSLIVRNNGVITNAVGNDTVMLDMETEKYFGTNKTGSYIYSLLETPTRFGSLCDRLVDDFNIPRDKCENEVAAFVREMQQLNLININL